MEREWVDLTHLLGYLLGTAEKSLLLGVDAGRRKMLFADASHATAEHMRSMAGVVVSFGRGAVLTQSHKVRRATISNCESELYAVSDAIVECLWLKNLAASLLRERVVCMVYQDNQSSIRVLLGDNESAKRTRHADIHREFLKDMYNHGEYEVEYLPTKAMVADGATKALSGEDFNQYARWVLGEDPATPQGSVPERGPADGVATGMIDG